MDTFYLILVVSLSVVTLALLLKYKPELIKRFWKYILGGLAILVSVVFLFGKLFKGKPDEVADKKTKKKRDKLDSDLQGVRKEATAEVEKAREDEKAVTDKLEEIHKITDEEERLKQLSELFNETRR